MAKLSLNTSLSFRMDSLSADNVHLLFGRRRGRRSVQRRQKSGFSRSPTCLRRELAELGTTGDKLLGNGRERL